MVGGELVLAAHADEQGAASPAGTQGQPQHPGDTPTAHPGVLLPSSSSAAPGHSQSLPEQLLQTQKESLDKEHEDMFLMSLMSNLHQG